MIIRTTIAATIATVALLTASGCAVTRGQESVGAYQAAEIPPAGAQR
ncbi:hypothetical protein RCH10_004267 [Variovorax sp. GrIS 2.14]